MAEAPDAAKRALLDTCLALPGVYEDYPFEDGDMATVRHLHNRKIFAFVFHREGRLQINLKCEPLRADFLRGMYQGVEPGWHMNRAHWNTVFPDSDVPEEELLMMISDSWKLTGGGKGRPKAKPGPKPKKKE